MSLPEAVKQARRWARARSRRTGACAKWARVFSYLVFCSFLPSYGTPGRCPLSALLLAFSESYWLC